MASITDDDIKTAIKDLLKGADLASLSSKKVRQRLEAKFDVDLTDRKQTIDDILMSLVQAASTKKEGGSPTPSRSGSEAGAEGSDSEPAAAPSREPPKKKIKKEGTPDPNSDDGNNSEAGSGEGGSESGEEGENDELLAKKLQEQESGSRRRTAKRAPPAEKKARKKKEKIPGVKRETHFTKQCVLSEELAELFGEDRMPRSEVVKRMWQIFKERKLQDPKNKQYYFCDEQLERIFKTKRLKAFGMMKTLKHHIKDCDLVT